MYKEKILTISIAAYNVSQYIRETIESCVVPEVLDDLDIIIVNDGSTDGTAGIAEEYVKRYPESFRLINKENGGYGTTVIQGMKEAKGKYFKLLDGDDWFDREGLAKLVRYLKEIDSDWVLTRVLRIKEGTNEMGKDTPSWSPYYGKTCTVADLADTNFSYNIGMWGLASKTALLREHPFVLPAHRLYTDQLFVFYQMPFVRKISFLDFPVYRYRIGRDGQSISRESRIRHYSDAVDNVLAMQDYYARYRELYPSNQYFMMHRLEAYYSFAIRTYLLLPASRKTMKDIISLEKRCKTKTNDVYKEAFHQKRKILIALRISNYAAYYPLACIGIKNWG